MAKERIREPNGLGDAALKAGSPSQIAGLEAGGITPYVHDPFITPTRSDFFDSPLSTGFF